MAMLPMEVCPRSPLASAVIVKNTFLDMDDEFDLGDVGPRRSSSEPPSNRNRDKPSCAMTFDTASSTTSGSPREMSGSDFASEERSSQQGSAELASPIAGLNPNAPVWSPSWSPAPPPVPMAGSGMPEPPPGTVFYQIQPDALPSPMIQNQVFGDQNFVAPPPPPPPPVGPGKYQIMTQHRLNANAKAWQPGTPMPVSAERDNNGMPAAVPPPPPAPTAISSLPKPYQAQVESIVESAKKALSNSSAIASVDIHESSISWNREYCQGLTITAWQAQDIGGKGRDQILKLAKNALLKGAEHSESVYVLGYGAKPFTTCDFGFHTVLGGMYDQSKACWDCFSKGSCKREWDCRWQHPACQLPIKVEIRTSRK